MQDLFMMLRSLGVALLIALFAMEWGEPPMVMSYGCFSGPGWFDIQFNAIRVHAKAIVLVSGGLLVAESALQLLLNFLDARANKVRGS